MLVIYFVVFFFFFFSLFSLINEVDASIAESNSKATDIVGTYATYDDTYSWVKSMCDKYPGLSTCKTYGTSTEGRTLFYMKLGLGSKAIFLEAGNHAREWINHASTVYVVNRVCL